MAGLVTECAAQERGDVLALVGRKAANAGAVAASSAADGSTRALARVEQRVLTALRDDLALGRHAGAALVEAQRLGGEVPA